jgi:hypothetical protein
MKLVKKFVEEGISWWNKVISRAGSNLLTYGSIVLRVHITVAQRT